MRSFFSGPPSAPPNWFRFRSSLAGAKKLLASKTLIAKEFEDLAMELVAPALGYDVDHRGAGALIRHQETHLDLELIDSRHRRTDRELAIPRDRTLKPLRE